MTAPAFLVLSEVLEIHAEQIALYGGEYGVRDRALLESAVAAPQAGIDGAYFHPGIFSMAAAYLFHISRNHPFVDGNKRTGLARAYLFLEINDVVLECAEDELVGMVLAVARGEMDKDGIAVFLRKRTQNGTLTQNSTLL